MTVVFFKALAGIAAAGTWVVGMVGLVLVDMGKLSVFPGQIISGVLAMFASFAILVIGFAHAVTTTTEK